MQYETQIWTLIGVILGYLLSFLTIGILNKKNYKKLLDTTTTKIVSYIRDNNVAVAIQAISELEASFKDLDQMEIISRASLESSLRASNNKITEYILEKLEWMMIDYTIYLDGTFNFKELGLHEKKEKNKINKIHSIIWTILKDVVEYHQSESIIKIGYQLIEILDKFSLRIKYYDLLVASIELYSDIGIHSIGTDYPKGFKVLNFRTGINLSINYLLRIRNLISENCKETNIREKLLKNIELNIKIIKVLERARLKKNQA